MQRIQKRNTITKQSGVQTWFCPSVSFIKRNVNQLAQIDLGKLKQISKPKTTC